MEQGGFVLRGVEGDAVGSGWDGLQSGGIVELDVGMVEYSAVD